MTENDLTELYCIVDDFYNRFIKTEAGKKNLDRYYGKRGPARRMSVPEIMTLNIARIFDRVSDLKTFHKSAAENYIKYFPKLTNYENFLKATNRAVGFIISFVQYQLFLNRTSCADDTFYLDSTPITVCENRYIGSHKVARSVARRGKTTKGWFYGFKLHGVCTKDGTLVRLCFRPGNEHDSKAFDASTSGLSGTFVTDAGYLLREAEILQMLMTGRKPCCAPRKNMRRLLTREQYRLLLNRNRIENVWQVMKLNYNLVYHRARSVTGMFRHFFYSISAFLFHLLDDACQWFLPILNLHQKLEF